MQLFHLLLLLRLLLLLHQRPLLPPLLQLRLAPLRHQQMQLLPMPSIRKSTRAGTTSTTCPMLHTWHSTDRQPWAIRSMLRHLSLTTRMPHQPLNSLPLHSRHSLQQPTSRRMATHRRPPRPILSTQPHMHTHYPSRHLH